MLKRLLTILPFALFMGLLLLPGIASVSRLPAGPPLQEFRKLAEWPVKDEFFAPGKPGFVAYAQQVDAWFSDNFATRPFWVRLYTQVQYSVFGESDQVHIGPDNWLYYRSVIDRETPGLERYGPEIRVQMIGRMARLSELLEARGITLYVMPLALKHAYYPEHLPAAAQHARHFTFYDAYLDEALADGRFNIIDSRPILRQAKADGVQVFHKTDFHWTDPAGGLVMKALIDEIGAESGRPDIAANFTFRTVPLVGLVGGQGRALPLFRPPAEDSIAVEMATPATTFAYKNGENGIEWQGVATSDTKDLFEPVFVYGDSFFDAGSRAGFFNNFRAFARARVWQNDIVTAFQNRPEGTRFMVVEHITSAAAGVDMHVLALISHLEAEQAAGAPPTEPGTVE